MSASLGTTENTTFPPQYQFQHQHPHGFLMRAIRSFPAPDGDSGDDFTILPSPKSRRESSYHGFEPHGNYYDAKEEIDGNIADEDTNMGRGSPVPAPVPVPGSPKHELRPPTPGLNVEIRPTRRRWRRMMMTSSFSNSCRQL